MILLAVIFFALCAVTGALLSARGSLFGLRVLFVLCVPAVAFAIWQAAQPPTGWPATATPPKLAEFQWGIVHEPDQLTHDPGWIVLWLTPPGETRPRAYRVPYTRQLHKQVEGATGVVKQGGRVAIRRVALRKAAYNKTPKMVFYVLPPAQPPSKD